MAGKEEQFKTTWKGGYDKDEVLQGYRELQGDLYEEKHNLQKGLERMEREIGEKTKKISELEARAAKCDKELAELQGNVRDNFQTYIDSYDAIGSQIFESRVYSDHVQKETQEERGRILDEAMAEAKQTRDAALAEAVKIREVTRAETEKQIADAGEQIERQAEVSRKKYDAVQQELQMLLGDFSQIRRKFMRAYKSIHDVLTDDSGDLAQMRLSELTAQSPTVRIPDLTAYLERNGHISPGVDEGGPTKNLTEVQKALEAAGIAGGEDDA